MTGAIHFKKRWLPAKRVKLSKATLEDLDLFLIARIASFFTLIEQSALSQISTHWQKAVIVRRAQELGYKGGDLIAARERIRNLCHRILVFQEQDQRTGFGGPQFPFEWNSLKKKKLFPHPLTLLYGTCKQLNVDGICSWFLLNPNHYMSQETPWIDFFEVDSSWKQVDQVSTRDKQLLFQALTYACYFYRPTLIQILLRKGAPVSGERLPHPVDPSLQVPMPLDSLILQEDQKLVSLLIDHGALIYSHHLVCALRKGGDLALFKFLLPKCHRPLLTFALLDEAISLESREAIELLVEAGCTINPEHALKLLYLFMTSRFYKKGDCSDPFASFLLPFLLVQGADLNGSSPAKHTLLHEAALQGSLPWAEWLLNHGAQVDVKTPHRRCTPLYYACDFLTRFSAPSSEDLALISLLLARGAKPILDGNDRDKSPYFLAQRNGSQEIVDLFDHYLLSFSHSN